MTCSSRLAMPLSNQPVFPEGEEEGESKKGKDSGKLQRVTSLPEHSVAEERETPPKSTPGPDWTIYMNHRVTKSASFTSQLIKPSCVGYFPGRDSGVSLQCPLTPGVTLGLSFLDHKMKNV